VDRLQTSKKAWKVVVASVVVVVRVEDNLLEAVVVLGLVPKAVVAAVVVVVVVVVDSPRTAGRNLLFVARVVVAKAAVTIEKTRSNFIFGFWF